MRPDGSDAQPLVVDGELQGRHPDWSPDGLRLALSINDDIWVADADGSHAVGVQGGAVATSRPGHLTGRSSSSPDTPASQKTPGPGADTSNLYVIQTDGSGLRPITDVVQGTRIIQPTWTPDGKAVIADLADVWIGVRVDPATGEVEEFAGCCVSHPRLRPTP